jgi:alkylation response protein AidB-like acyl-CoA dehydrogenase
MSLDFSLSPEQQLIRQSTADLVKRFEPQRERFLRMITQENRFPEELSEAIGQAGFAGCLIPEKYGGTNIGLLPLVLFSEEMGTQGYGNALFAITQLDTACIAHYAPEALKEEILPGVASGRRRLAFALTEPNAGSNSFAIQTTAKRSGDGFELNGQKIFITGADAADQILVVAKTMPWGEAKEKGFPKGYGFSLFLVDRDAPGLERKPISTRGLEAARQFTLYFDKVKVPANRLVGAENAGLAALFHTLNVERVLISAYVLGMSEYLLRKAVDYAKERKVFKDTPIGAYQAIQHPLAEIKIRQEGARLLTYRAAWAYDQGRDPAEVGTYANMAKYLACEMAIDAADRAIETLGGYGFSEEYGIVHYWEATRLFRTIPVTREMLLNFVGEHVLGLPKSY